MGPLFTPFHCGVFLSVAIMSIDACTDAGVYSRLGGLDRCEPVYCNHCHVHPHDIRDPPFRLSPFHMCWQFHPLHHSLNIPIIFPPNMSKPLQSCLSCFISKRSHLPCASGVLIPYLVYSCHSQSKS